MKLKAKLKIRKMYKPFLSLVISSLFNQARTFINFIIYDDIRRYIFRPQPAAKGSSFDNGMHIYTDLLLQLRAKRAEKFEPYSCISFSKKKDSVREWEILMG